MTTALRAEELLKELGVTTPHDIDVDAIAYSCGALVKYRALTGAEARLVGHGDNGIITVNSSSSLRRKRFSVAHELGHWTYHRGKVGYLCRSNDINEDSQGSKKGKETVANHYAADLLMPSFLFKKSINNLDITFDSIRKVSDEYQTSITATAIRAIQFTDKPSMVVCYSSKGRKWFQSSSTVPEGFFPVRELDPDSKAFALLYSTGSLSTPSTMRAPIWIDHRTSSGYEIIEQAMKVSDDSVIVTLWWEDESQITDYLDSL